MILTSSSSHKTNLNASSSHEMNVSAKFLSKMQMWSLIQFINANITARSSLSEGIACSSSQKTLMLLLVSLNANVSAGPVIKC